MRLQLALPLPRALLWQPLTVLTRQTRQAVCALNQSIFLRCLWVLCTTMSHWNKFTVMLLPESFTALFIIMYLNISDINTVIRNVAFHNCKLLNRLLSTTVKVILFSLQYFCSFCVTVIRLFVLPRTGTIKLFTFVVGHLMSNNL